MLNPRLMQLLFGLITLGCLAGVILANARQPEVVLRVAFLASQDDEDYVGALAFKQRLERDSNGRIVVQIFPSGQFCGNERECIEGLESGILDVHQTTIGGLANIFGEGQVLDMPYAYANDQVAECVFDGPLIQDVQQAIIDKGLRLRLMAVGNTGGWRSFSAVDRPINTPADLKNLKIRTTPSALEQEMVRELGANPTPIPWSEVYQALGYGILDGTKNSVQDMVGMKFQEKIKYLFADQHAYMAALWWMSDKSWQAIPKDLQPLVKAGFKDLKQATRQAARQREKPALEAFIQAGGTIHTPTPSERQSFITATQGVRAWYAKRYGEAWLNRLDTAIANCSKGVI